MPRKVINSLIQFEKTYLPKAFHERQRDPARDSKELGLELADATLRDLRKKLAKQVTKAS